VAGGRHSSLGAVDIVAFLSMLAVVGQTMASVRFDSVLKFSCVVMG
jgi:hypothetical protein